MYREAPYTDMDEMFRNDSLATSLGMRLLEWSPGRCRVSLVVSKGMLNAYGAAHGSVIFALADIAFAISCNSRGVKSVGLSMSMHYRRPAGEGERLTAEAFEESTGKTTSVCRIRVTNGEGKIVALADGLSYQIK